jgi:hypothetical protein
MPIKHAIWKVGKPAERLSEVFLATEQILEEMIVSDPRILSDEWMASKRTLGGAAGSIFFELLRTELSCLSS